MLRRSSSQVASRKLAHQRPEDAIKLPHIDRMLRVLLERSWVKGFRRCLLAAASVQYLSIVNAVAAGDPRGPATELSGASVLSPCHLPDVEQIARCGVLDVPESPD